VKYLSKIFIAISYLLTPLFPLLLSILFRNKQYVLQYAQSIKKIRIHLHALSNGPVTHFLEDVFLRAHHIPAQIQGSCVQCGNCCLNKQCFFITPVQEDKFQCGIYGSFWRRFSNCNSYPLHANDIERYACPSYSVVRIHPVATPHASNPIVNQAPI